MIPLLSVDQLRDWDAYTLEQLRIPEHTLMERASEAVVDSFMKRYARHHRVYVLAGKGNNGGDGLCIARLLSEEGYKVEAYLFGDESKASAGCRYALARWRAHSGSLYALSTLSDLERTPLFQRKSSDDVWMDALLGVGIRGPVDGEMAKAIEALNHLPSESVSIDVPSGMMLDTPQEGVSVRADYLLSLQLPRRAFLLPQNGRHIKQWRWVDIGLSPEFLDNTTPDHGYMIEEDDARRWLPQLQRHTHKNEVGRGLLVAGREGMLGAAVLAARAALRGGIGAVHLHTPYRGVNLLHTTVPEAIVQTDPHPTHVTRVRVPGQARVVAVGPGIGVDLPTASALRGLLRDVDAPIILDADALNILSTYRDLIQELPPDSLLTPHEGELARLVGKWSNDYDKIERTRAFARHTRSIIVIKGAYSLVIDPEEPLLFNSTGNPGMATAGSGDVLTGLLLALRTLGLSARRAAALGVFLHGRAGDLAADQLSARSLTASDLIDYLPIALRTLEKDELKSTSKPPSSS